MSDKSGLLGQGLGHEQPIERIGAPNLRIGDRVRVTSSGIQLL